MGIARTGTEFCRRYCQKLRLSFHLDMQLIVIKNEKQMLLQHCSKVLLPLCLQLFTCVRSDISFKIVSVIESPVVDVPLKAVVHVLKNEPFLFSSLNCFIKQFTFFIITFDCFHLSKISAVKISCRWGFCLAPPVDGPCRNVVPYLSSSSIAHKSKSLRCVRCVLQILTLVFIFSNSCSCSR